jgi:hypothetical protein
MLFPPFCEEHQKLCSSLNAGMLERGNDGGACSTICLTDDLQENCADGTEQRKDEADCPPENGWGVVL